MKNIKYINEWLDAPGSIDAPGSTMEVKVNARNYQSVNQQTTPNIIDSVYEKSYFFDFLKEQGNSKEFNDLLESEKSGKRITDWLIYRFEETKKS